MKKKVTRPATVAILGIAIFLFSWLLVSNNLMQSTNDQITEKIIAPDKSRDAEGDTFSIIAYDPVTGEVGGAGCSCFGGTIDFLSDLVLDGSNNILGGIHTQASYQSGNQTIARNRMLAGDTPQQIVDFVTANDCCGGPAARQYGVVGFNGSTLETAGYTGSSNGNWAGNITGPTYAIQGNILDTSDQMDILTDMESAFLNSTGTLADKLMAALQGAKRVGGDNRCNSASWGMSGRAAFVKVLRPGDTTPYIDISVYPNFTFYEPIDDLQCSYDTAVSTPFCRQTVNAFPYTMDFELKSWEKEATCSTYSSWIRSRFATPSSNTGPGGANQGALYTFVEASNINGQGTAPRNAIIGSPCFDIPASHTAELTFDYHMWGASMGTLAITASNNGGASWATLWSISGDQGNGWTNDQSVDLSIYAGSTVKLRFDAITGNGFASDMAIDDVQITVTSAVPDTEPPTAPTNLIASNTSSTTTDLSWSPSIDNIGVIGYDVYEGAVVIGSTPVPNFNVTGLVASTNYSFSVIAKDAAGNESPASNTLPVTTEDEPPVNCTNLIDTYPYSESYETSFGVWIQSTADDLNWTRKSNGTPSNNTGPSSAFDETFYIYVEASGNGTGYPNKRAILESPCFDLSDKTAANFDFNYHMFGAADMGSISLEVSINGGTTWASLWNQSGNQGNGWLLQATDLAPYLGESAVMLRFNRLTGSTWQADIAIDNIVLTATGGPDIEPPTAPTNLTASNITTTTTDLTWTASTDNIAVTGYDVYDGAVVIGTTTNVSFNVTGLIPSTNYTFSVVAKDAAGNESPPSNSVMVTTEAPPDTEAPSAPTNLVASNTTTTSTDLSWTASTDNVGVTEYDVYDGLSIIGSSPTPSFNVTALTPSTNYSFTVVAKDAAGNESAASAALIITTLDDTTPPSAPTNLVASNTTTTTTDLSWTGSTDDIGVTDYDVYEGVVIIGTTTGTSFNVTGLSPSTNYSFSVVAKDAAGNESPPSNSVVVTTETPPDTEAPTAPTNLVASNTTTTSTDLFWTASTDNVGVTEYDVYEGVSIIGSTPTTSFSVTGLAPATNYSFTVVAKDAAGNESAASAELIITTLDDTTPPSAPTNLVASNTTTTTTDLSWTASTDDIGVTEYDVYEGVAIIGSTATASFNVTGLVPSMNYTFTVVAKDAAGNESAASAALIVTTLDDTTPPTAPINLTAFDITDTTLDLSWTASTDDIGVTGYDVYEGSTLIDNVTSTTASVTGLTAGTGYSFTVRARDAAGNVSAASNAVAVTTTGGVGCTGGIGIPYTESFESSIGAWTQSITDDINWTRDSGGTPSSNTGPSSGSSGAFYIYVEASGNGTGYPNKQAILNSPCVDLTGETEASFNFDYHMFGATNMGSIALEASTDGSSWTSLWSQTGNKGNQWNAQSVDLAAYVGGTIELRFNRITGNTWQADIALDNMSLTVGGGDPNPPTGYCASNGNITSDEYIQRVQIGSIDNTTGASAGGYGNFTNLSTNLNTNNTITITPFWTGTIYAEGYAVWVDWNRDGDFADTGELAFSQSATTDTPVGGAINVPGGASAGPTRMRVSMKYNGIPTSCESFQWGEVEDYIVVIPMSLQGFVGVGDAINMERETGISLRPNPVNRGTLNVSLLNDIGNDYIIYNMVGQIVGQDVFTRSIDVSQLQSGMYMIQVNSGTNKYIERFIIE